MTKTGCQRNTHPELGEKITEEIAIGVLITVAAEIGFGGLNGVLGSCV
jgi:hypothetical protein